jgi:hypothetical protein
MGERADTPKKNAPLLRDFEQRLAEENANPKLLALIRGLIIEAEAEIDRAA